MGGGPGVDGGDGLCLGKKESFLIAIAVRVSLNPHCGKSDRGSPCPRTFRTAQFYLRARVKHWTLYTVGMGEIRPFCPEVKSTGCAKGKPQTNQLSVTPSATAM